MLNYNNEVAQRIAAFLETDEKGVERLQELVDEYDIDIIAAFVDNYHHLLVDTDDWADDFIDSYRGVWSSEKDFAEDIAYDLYFIPEEISYYFDYDKLARDLFIGDYWFDRGTGAVFASY